MVVTGDFVGGFEWVGPGQDVARKDQGNLNNAQKFVRHAQVSVRLYFIKR